MKNEARSPEDDIDLRVINSALVTDLNNDILNKQQDDAEFIEQPNSRPQSSLKAKSYEGLKKKNNDLEHGTPHD